MGGAAQALSSAHEKVSSDMSEPWSVQFAISVVEYALHSYIQKKSAPSSSWPVYTYIRSPSTIGAGSLVNHVCTIGFCAPLIIGSAIAAAVAIQRKKLVFPFVIINITCYIKYSGCKVRNNSRLCTPKL